MLNLVQHPWSHAAVARNADGVPWTLNQVQGDDGALKRPSPKPSFDKLGANG
jgi:hypothetical protein